MNKVIKYLLSAVLFILLAAVRYFENQLFYDPLIPFFKSNFATLSLPELIFPKYYIHLTLRYGINALLSLAILWFLFRKFEIIKISVLIYTVFFIVLLIAMGYLLQISEAGNYQLLFYVRRFLIQPLLILLLIPAFYFVKR